MQSIRKYCVVGKAKPNKRSNNSKEVLFPIIKDGISLEGVKDRYIEMYREVLSAIDKVSYVDKAYEEVANKLNLTANTIALRVNEVRMYLLRELEEGAVSKIDLKPSLDVLLTHIPNIQEKDLVEFIKSLVLERDYYKKKCEDLQDELKALHSEIFGTVKAQ